MGLMFRSLASLLSELKQMKEHVAAQEREMGTRTQVREEFNLRSEAFNRAVEEVKRAQSSLKVQVQGSLSLANIQFTFIS